MAATKNCSMKKLYYFLVCSALIWASCSDNGKKENGPEPPAKVTADVLYQAQGGTDYLSLFNLSVKYTDTEGKTTTEPVTELPWSKTLENVTVPFTAQLEFIHEPTESYPEKDTYEVGFGCGIGYSTTDGQNYDGSSSSKMSVGRDKIEAYRQSVAARTYEATKQIEPAR